MVARVEMVRKENSGVYAVPMDYVDKVKGYEAVFADGNLVPMDHITNVNNNEISFDIDTNDAKIEADIVTE